MLSDWRGRGKQLRIVIISCSNRKREFSQAIPAIDVYDGPYYKTIRKLLREGKLPEDIKILIISAKYGLISIKDHIEFYDRRITKKIAEELKPKVLSKFQQEIKSECEELVINLGIDYLPAVEGIESLIPDGCQIKYITGTIIKRRQKLKEYLTHE